MPTENICKGWYLVLSTGKSIVMTQYLSAKSPNMTSLQPSDIPKMLHMQIQLNNQHWYQVFYQSLNSYDIPNNVPSGYQSEPPIVVPSNFTTSLSTIWLQIIAIDPPKRFNKYITFFQSLLLIFNVPIHISKIWRNGPSTSPVNYYSVNVS